MTKKKFLLIMPILLVTCMLTMLFCSCGKTEKDPYINVEGMTVVYLKNDQDVVPAGAVVNYYENKETKNPTKIALTRSMITGLDTLTEGSRTMTITYKDLTCKLDYIVYSKAQLKTMVENAITKTLSIDKFAFRMAQGENIADYIVTKEVMYRVAQGEGPIDAGEFWYEKHVDDNGYDLYSKEPTTGEEYKYEVRHVTSNSFVQEKIGWIFPFATIAEADICSVKKVENGIEISCLQVDEEYGESYSITFVVSTEGLMMSWDIEGLNYIYTYENIGDIPARPTNVEWIDPSQPQV